jgi:pimeloyl-[acyl-carrier protein] synthase
VLARCIRRARALPDGEHQAMSEATLSPVANPDFGLDGTQWGNRLLEKFDELRATDPIFWSDVNRAWIVTGHREVTEGYQGRLPLSSRRFPEAGVAHLTPEQREQLPHVLAAPKGWLLNMDPPAYNRLRQLMMRAFGPAVVETIQPFVQRYVAEVMEHAEQLEGPFDFVSEIAKVVPSRMVLRQFGLDDSLMSLTEKWTVLNLNGNPMATFEQMQMVDEALAEMRAMFIPLIEDRRRNPQDDFISYLVHSEIKGDRLTDDEIIGTCQITFIAGHDTTINTIAMGTALLSKEPEFCAYLRQHPEAYPNALLELQRRISMSTLMSRVVSEDFEWHGHQMKAGQVVLLCQGAANQDPNVFPEPARLDPERDQQKNMTFAPGLHHCIGHYLAKMMLNEFFPRFLERFDVEVLDKELNYAAPVAFRGLQSLTVKLHKRAAH